MNEHGVISEPVAPANGETPASPPAAVPEPLEQRVSRLEDAVSMLQDTRKLEERITERVSNRLKRAQAQALQETAGTVVTVGRRLLPAALTAIRGQADQADQQAPSAAPRFRGSWLLVDVYAEGRAMVRMFLDPRFRPGWAARVVPLVLVAAILTSWIWLPGTSILPSSVATLIDKTIDLLLAFLAFKVLSREAARYRECLADSPIAPRA
jgi:hypothetical protein